MTGVLGLVAVKNLREEGFQVTGFDRNDYVGGLWKYTEEDKTSVLPCNASSLFYDTSADIKLATIINISKERVGQQLSQ